MTYNERIRDLRIDHDMTQAQMAILLGTTTQYYQKYEKGVRPLPLIHLEKICRFFNVSADYIIGLPKGMERPR